MVQAGSVLSSSALYCRSVVGGFDAGSFKRVVGRRGTWFVLPPPLLLLSLLTSLSHSYIATNPQNLNHCKHSLVLRLLYSTLNRLRTSISATAWPHHRPRSSAGTLSSRRPKASTSGAHLSDSTPTCGRSQTCSASTQSCSNGSSSPSRPSSCCSPSPKPTRRCVWPRTRRLKRMASRKSRMSCSSSRRVRTTRG